MMQTRGILRLNRVAQHLRSFAASTNATNASIRAIEIADDPELWRKAGFAVDTSGKCMIGDCAIQLSGPTEDKLGLVSWGLGDVTAELLEGVTTKAAAVSLQSKGIRTPHPNGTIELAELVVYVQNVEQTYSNFTAAGIVSHKQSPPRAMKGGKHTNVIYFLGPTRLMILGPTDPSMPADQNPKMWMFGTGSAPTELVGWLPVVEDIDVLKNVLGEKAGSVKKAAQKSRQICSLSSEKSGMTGTFAFLSDSGGSVF
jgi:hypothetical protein